MEEAANEIEGLRKWNAWFAAHNTELKTKNKEAADEIERLRDRVETAAQYVEFLSDSVYRAPTDAAPTT